MMCKHMDFVAVVSVHRLEDSGQFMADVEVECAECKEPFHFKGLERGLNLNGASISVDGLEARLAIAPGPLPIESFGTMKFRL